MAEAPSLFLCVDCGGSKTAAAIATKDGTVVGRGTGGPSNFTDVGLADFVVAFSDAVASAYKAATGAAVAPTFPLVEGALQAAWVGVAGVDSPSAVAALTNALAPLLALPASAPRLVVANDTHLLASPLRLHGDIDTAVVAIAGTGSIVVSFRQRPKEDGGLDELGRVGGWGWLLGDDGSGFFVGREAVREILTRADRARVTNEPAAPSMLRDRVFALYGISDPYDIFGVIYAADPAPGAPGAAKPILDKERKHRMASLAPVVFECAFVHHDELALTVLRNSARALAKQIAAVLKTENDADPPANAAFASSSILCLGGSLVSQETYQNLLKEELAALGHVFRYVQYVDDVTALGAAGLAGAA